jgi:predicted lysophospholipase L1 biosynthesis ABC-type transport system permease subunit
MTQESKMEDLKWQLKERLQLDPKTVQLFADQGMKKKIVAADSMLLIKAGIKHGDMIYIGNQDVVMTSVVEAQ